MERNYKRKLLVIGVIFLFLGASATLCVNAKAPFTENFDSYTAGTALHGQGGWHGWDNFSTVTGYVSTVQSQSPSNSLEIQWYSGTAADMVHEFSDVNSGTWNVIAHIYVPSTMTGNTFFILMNKYVNGTHNNQDWSLQLIMSRTAGTIADYNDATKTLPLVTNAWAEIRVEINFATDWEIIYYNDQQLNAKTWSSGGGTAGGLKNLAAVDLYADSAVSSAVYWDDLSVMPVTEPLICNANGPYAAKENIAIQFNGTVTGGWPPYTWEWHFGDGATSTVQNPTHAYTHAGVYNVTLTVTDSLASTASSQTTATITALQPVISIGQIIGGLFKVKAIVRNTGDGVAANVSWTIDLNGGFILLGKHSTGTISAIPANGGQATITSKMVLGFGKPTITVTVGTATKNATATVLLVYIII